MYIMYTVYCNVNGETSKNDVIEFLRRMKWNLVFAYFAVPPIRGKLLLNYVDNDTQVQCSMQIKHTSQFHFLSIKYTKN